ncbi:MAG: MFS transporter [Bacillota bacterium]
MTHKESLVPLKMMLFSFHGANTMVISFLPLLLAYRGLSEQEIGWVLAVGPTVSIISQPLFGYISDKFQTVKKVLLVATLGLIISSFFFFQMEVLGVLLFSAVFFYFFSSAIAPLADSLAQRRAKALNVPFGSIRTWGSIGFAISSLVIGQYVDWVGIQYLFIPYGMMTITLLLLTTRLKDVKVDTKPINFKDVGKLLRNKQFITLLLVMFLVTITHRTNDSFIGLYIRQIGGRDNLVGLAWFLGVFSEAIVFMFAGKWFRKFHPLVFMIIAAWLYTLRWLVYGIVADPYVLVVMQVFHGLSFGVFYVASFDYVSRLIPEHMQATGHLIFMTVFFGFSGIIGSLGGGYVLEVLGGQTLYIAMGIMTIVGSLLIGVYHWFYKNSY